MKGVANQNDSPEQMGPDSSDIERRLNSLWQTSTTKDLADQSIAGYRIEGVLGRGAFGIVYLAIDPESGRKIALKVPRPEVLLDPEKRRRFEAEASLARTLRHEGIVEVFRADLSGPMPFIAAAFCNGPNLAEWLGEQNEPPPWQESARLVAKIADAIDSAHQKGISHRDLKPANIMLVPIDKTRSQLDSLDDCIPKVTDFGLAKLSDPTMTDTRSSLLIGTPCYMAPEQMDRHLNSDNSIATDIYSLGVVLFELLTGQLPVAGDSYFEVLDNIRSAKPIGLRQLRADVPRDLAKICSVCLRKTPEARYESAAALAQDLRNCADNKAITGKRWSLIQKAKNWCLHPDRLKTAGAYTFGSQILVTIWFYACIASLCFFSIVTWEQYTKIMKQDAMLIVGTSIPMCWGGWLALKGIRKGAWVAMALTLFVLPLSIAALIFEPVLFKSVYSNQDPYFSFVIHMVPATSLAIQAILLGIALIATKTKRGSGVG